MFFTHRYPRGPENIDRIEVDQNDRPYAGWLCASFSYQTRTQQQMDTLEFQLGVIGPASLAKEAQDFIHNLRRFEKFAGWDNQLGNEPGLVFLWEHKRKFRFYEIDGQGFGHDVIVHSGVTLGNVATYVNVGAEIRAGWRIPNDFGTSAVRPGGDNSAPDSTWDPRITVSKSWGIHAFASFDLRLVGRDVFLDGNTFKDSHSIDRKVLVGDLSLGVSYIYHAIKLSYAQVFRSREFVGQEHPHSYGSVSLSWTF